MSFFKIFPRHCITPFSFYHLSNHIFISLTFSFSLSLHSLSLFLSRSFFLFSLLYFSLPLPISSPFLSFSSFHSLGSWHSLLLTSLPYLSLSPFPLFPQMRKIVKVTPVSWFRHHMKQIIDKVSLGCHHTFIQSSFIRPFIYSVCSFVIVHNFKTGILSCWCFGEVVFYVGCISPLY